MRGLIVGAVYFEAARQRAGSRAKRKRDSAQPQKIGRRYIR